MQFRQSEASKEKDARVRQILEHIRHAAKRCSGSRRRFASYKYLRAVYRGYWTLEDAELLSGLRRVLDREYGVPDELKWHPIRAIIEATTKLGDIRLRSRWTRALEYARNEEVKPRELIWFIRRNDGIAGCARRAAGALPKRKTKRDDWANDIEFNPPRFESDSLARNKKNFRTRKTLGAWRHGGDTAQFRK